MTNDISAASDTLGRPFKDLRISVTDRCNYRCVYCMPLQEYAWLRRDEILSFEEISRLARIGSVSTAPGSRSLAMAGESVWSPNTSRHSNALHQRPAVSRASASVSMHWRAQSAHSSGPVWEPIAADREERRALGPNDAASARKQDGRGTIGGGLFLLGLKIDSPYVIGYGLGLMLDDIDDIGNWLDFKKGGDPNSFISFE